MIHVKWGMQCCDKNLRNTVDYLNLQHHYGNVGELELRKGTIENVVTKEKVVDIYIYIS